jgi:hypothetical protein
MDASLANISFAAFLVAHLFAVIAVPKIKFRDDQPSSTGTGILPQKDRSHTARVQGGSLSRSKMLRDAMTL